jgi:hypothetical protein
VEQARRRLRNAFYERNFGFAADICAFGDWSAIVFRRSQSSFKKIPQKNFARNRHL